ncbi:hypothetical protein N0V84_011893 [Fusarium piperis]|uniref:Aminoglycoside phosphotransferase domain-containing protein n=1 Tax=Fusarium piperis TaxID=1435070 RepID=A0A9W8W2N9_9HYPO|nr:hypothetical protein N0V84_011893 [Fusarium piperis]
MASENVCSACSWSPSRQDGCRYHSQIKLFYGVSDRGVWSVGSKLVIKDRPARPPNSEAVNIAFLQAHTTLPIAPIVTSWDEDGRSFFVSKRIPGKPLNEAWASMTAEDKHRVAKQTSACLDQLRLLHSLRVQTVDGKPVFSAFLFPVGYGIPHGPFSSDQELWEEFAKALQHVPEHATKRLRERMPTSTPYTFTHGDLTNVNIMVQDGHLTGILDWESAGYYPTWWEFVSAGISGEEDDREWKTILHEYMPAYHNEREFFRDYYALSRYPVVNERVERLLQPPC